MVSGRTGHNWREKGREGEGVFGVGGYLGISLLPPASGVTWLPAGPHGCISADVAGCKPEASLLRLLWIAAVLGMAWGAGPSLEL